MFLSLIRSSPLPSPPVRQVLFPRRSLTQTQTQTQLRIRCLSTYKVKDDDEVLISLRNCSIRPHLPHHSYALKGPPIALQGINWTLRRGENWVCTGPNGCGKSTFVRALVGKATVVKGELRSKITSSACVSFADHERLKAMTDYMASHGADMEEEGLTVSSLLKDSRLLTEGKESSGETIELVEEFVDYKSLWKRNLDSLSSGELRRILILHALFGRREQVELLILDEAFDFIDERRRDLLARLLNDVAANNPDTRIILVSHREQDLAKLTFLTNRLSFPGRNSAGDGGESNLNAVSSEIYKDNLGAISHKTIQERNDFVSEVRMLVNCSLELRRSFEPPSTTRSNGPVVEIHGATLSYSEDEPPVLRNTTLVVHKGQRVLLCGPSGSGKSLLLSLITGENPQCYSNHVKVFGRSLGVNEDSLDSRRKLLGHFSPSMCQSRFLYNRQKPALEVVADGIMQAFELRGGELSETHKQLARDWANLFLKGVGSSAEQPYQTLSQGQRTAVLLARALISAPRLLLLDEPFTSLDVHTRSRLKETIQCVLQCNPDCAVVATSHYPMEDFPYFDNKLMLVRSASEQMFHLARMRSSTVSAMAH